MAGVNRTIGKATDLITFSRASGGTALRKISYGSEQFSATSPDFLQNATASGFTVTATGTPARASFELSGLTVGKAYLVTASATNANLLWDDSLDLAGTVQEAISAGDNILVAANSTMHIGFKDFSATAGKEYVFSNISVKEVLFDQPDGTLTLFNHPDNIPRIEYAADGTVKGLLIEEQRTNLVTYSEDFTNAAWLKMNVDLSLDDSAAPNGGDMITLTSTGAPSDTAIAQFTTASVGTVYTVSVFVRRDQHRYATFFGFGNGSAGVVFDLLLGTSQINATWIDSGIEIISPTVVRIYGVVSPVSTNSLYIGFASDINGGRTFSGGETLSFWGAQLEAGSFPTSYIPTSGATATRAADIASISVDNFGYRQDAGTLFVDVNSFGDNTYQYAVALTPSSATGAFEIALRKSVSNWNYAVNDNSVTQANITEAFAAEAKLAGAYKANSFNASINGSTETEDTSGIVPSGLVDLRIGRQTSFQLNGHIKSLTYYPRRLSNAQLVQLTA